MNAFGYVLQKVLLLLAFENSVERPEFGYSSVESMEVESGYGYFFLIKISIYLMEEFF